MDNNNNNNNNKKSTTATKTTKPRKPRTKKPFDANIAKKFKSINPALKDPSIDLNKMFKSEEEAAFHIGFLEGLDWFTEWAEGLAKVSEEMEQRKKEEEELAKQKNQTDNK